LARYVEGVTDHTSSSRKIEGKEIHLPSGLTEIGCEKFRSKKGGIQEEGETSKKRSYYGDGWVGPTEKKGCYVLRPRPAQCQDLSATMKVSKILKNTPLSDTREHKSGKCKRRLR